MWIKIVATVLIANSAQAGTFYCDTPEQLQEAAYAMEHKLPLNNGCLLLGNKAYLFPGLRVVSEREYAFGTIMEVTDGHTRYMLVTKSPGSAVPH